MDLAITKQDEIQALVLRAMSRFQAGDVDAGLALYDRALCTPPDNSIPIGLHCRMLTTIGQGPAADHIRRRALGFGWDIASLLGPLTARRQEYEALLSQGQGNASMVDGYLRVLDQIGDVAAIRPWTALDPLLQQRVLPAGLSADLREAAADALYDRALQHPPQSENKSIRNLRRVKRAHAINHPALTALHEALHELARGYADMLRGMAHPHGLLAPGEFALRSWGVVSDGTGYNVAHAHGAAFVVAVTYLRVPALTGRGVDDCQLHVGAPPGVAHPHAWMDANISPEPGMVVLMPGYFQHWTRPYSGGGTRISLAVNFVAGHVPGSQPDDGRDD